MLNLECINTFHKLLITMGWRGLGVIHRQLIIETEREQSMKEHRWKKWAQKKEGEERRMEEKEGNSNVHFSVVSVSTLYV